MTPKTAHTRKAEKFSKTLFLCSRVAKESEKDLEKRLFKEVKLKGGHALKFSSATETGYPDRIVLMPCGRTYFVEVKSEGKKPRKLQQIRHDELRALGFEVYVVDSTATLNQFIDML